MSHYDDFCEANQKNNREWFEFRERSFGHIESLVNSLATEWQIPAGRIGFLKWNGETDDDRLYSESETGRYTMAGATDYDESDGYWHLGVMVVLSEKTLPVEWIGFALCVSEDNGKLVVKINADGKPVPLDTSDKDRVHDFFENLAMQFRTLLSKDRTGTKKQLGTQTGFMVPPPPTQTIEVDL